MKQGWPASQARQDRAQGRRLTGVYMEEAHVSTGMGRSLDPWQWRGRQEDGLAYGAIGATDGRGRAEVDRRLLSQYRLPPQQERDWSARVAHLARHAAQFGTMISGPVTTDMGKVRQRKRNMVEAGIAQHIDLYQTTGGELIMGTGRFVAPKTLEVRLNDGGARVLTGDQVFLDIGTHAAIPSVPGLDAARPLTHIEALELDYLPSHLVVLGGG